MCPSKTGREVAKYFPKPTPPLHVAEVHHLALVIPLVLTLRKYVKFAMWVL